MNDTPRQKLCEIVASYSRSICDDARQCEGLLRDLCSGYKRETHVLVSALRERVPQELLNTSSSGITPELAIARLSKRLHDDLAMTEEAARWAVESWALALGVITMIEITKFAANKPLAIPKTPLSQTIPALQLQPYSAHDLSQSPEVRGFRLGMRLEEVLRCFNGLEVKSANEVGLQEIKLYVSTNIGVTSKLKSEQLRLLEKYEDKGLRNTANGAYVNKEVFPCLEGLNSLEFQFLDGQISSIHLEYDSSVKWSSVEEFTKKISELLRLSGTWELVGHSRKRLRAKTYWIEVNVGTYSGSNLRLQDSEAEHVIKERMAAKEDHQRRTFNL